jgi:hypothetical protein
MWATFHTAFHCSEKFSDVLNARQTGRCVASEAVQRTVYIEPVGALRSARQAQLGEEHGRYPIEI